MTDQMGQLSWTYLEEGLVGEFHRPDVEMAIPIPTNIPLRTLLCGHIYLERR